MHISIFLSKYIHKEHCKPSPTKSWRIFWIVERWSFGDMILGHGFPTWSCRYGGSPPEQGSYSEFGSQKKKNLRNCVVMRWWLPRQWLLYGVESCFCLVISYLQKFRAPKMYSELLECLGNAQTWAMWLLSKQAKNQNARFEGECFLRML